MTDATSPGASGSSYDYLTLDVFTERRFGGNPLAVLPNAQGLSTAQMQTIAAEFNYSETTFVTPSERGLGPRVRIFTPRAELPFAGHPTVGTAVALRQLGIIEGDEAVLEEGAGPVPVRFSDARTVSFQAPGGPLLEAFGNAEQAAATLSLDVAQIRTAPARAGAGLAFPIAELTDMQALRNVRMSAFDTPFRDEIVAFVQTGPERLAVRMFAPGHGIIEDPATGSAAAALAVLLASRHEAMDADLSWRIDQGVEMGRPSIIHIRAIKSAGEIREVHVRGSAVFVACGRIDV